MEVKYRSDMYTNYILMEIPEDADLQTYSFKMIEKNQIKGVLPAKVRMEDGKGYLYLDVGNRKNLVDIYKDKEMDLEEMTRIFQGLLPILEELRNYLLTEKMICLDPRFIFEEEERGYSIVVLPWQEENTGFRRMAEFFLEKINQKDENGVNAAYHFYRLQSQEPFSLYHFMPVLEKENILKRQKKNKEENSLIPQQPEWNIEEVGQSKVEDIQEGDSNIGGKVKYIFLVIAFIGLAIQFLQPIPSRIKLSCLALSIVSVFLFFFSFILKGERKKERKEKVTEEPVKEEWEVGETVFFEATEREEDWKLQWKERGRLKQTTIDSFPCKIGKIKEEVSIVMNDVSVSRVHCQFIKKENKVAIMDLNSTNGTSLNGMPLKQGEILEIEKNDEILIGKVKVLVV